MGLFAWTSVSGCPQLLAGCCDSPRAESCHLRTVQQRLVALDVADPELVRAVDVEPAVHEVLGELGCRVPAGTAHA